MRNAKIIENSEIWFDSKLIRIFVSQLKLLTATSDYDSDDFTEDSCGFDLY